MLTTANCCLKCHMLTLFTIYSAFAVFANVSNPEIYHENSLRFLLKKLESTKQHIRLAQVLLQDIDMEFPGLRHRLDAENGRLISQENLTDQWELSMGQNEPTSEVDPNTQQLEFLFGDAAILNLDYLYSGTIT
jgi:hypothetical protein